jgi:hypothetical protein
MTHTHTHTHTHTYAHTYAHTGAFHVAKPSDLLAELQGRLPIRVELKPLTEEDMYLILTVPENNLVRQQIALLGTEKVKLSFSEDSIRCVQVCVCTYTFVCVCAHIISLYLYTGMHVSACLVIICGVSRAVAQVAFEVNSTIENIGARRLHTVIERIMDEVSFTADEHAGDFVIEYVLLHMISRHTCAYLCTHTHMHAHMFYPDDLATHMRVFMHTHIHTYATPPCVVSLETDLLWPSVCMCVLCVVCVLSAKYVHERVAPILKKSDLSKYVL